MDLDRLRMAADQSSTLRTSAHRATGWRSTRRFQQTAGCNAAHPVESRLSRCLLHTHDLSGDYRLLLTQESMAQMIGRGATACRWLPTPCSTPISFTTAADTSRSQPGRTAPDGMRMLPTVKAQYERLVGS
jgi:hypothetical protein